MINAKLSMQIGIIPRVGVELDEDLRDRAMQAAQSVERAVNEILLGNNFPNTVSVHASTGEPVYIGGFTPANKEDNKLVSSIGVFSSTAIETMPGGIDKGERIYRAERLHDEMRYVDDGCMDRRSYL